MRIKSDKPYYNYDCESEILIVNGEKFYKIQDKKRNTQNNKYVSGKDETRVLKTNSKGQIKVITEKRPIEWDILNNPIKYKTVKVADLKTSYSYRYTDYKCRVDGINRYCFSFREIVEHYEEYCEDGVKIKTVTLTEEGETIYE